MKCRVLEEVVITTYENCKGYDEDEKEGADSLGEIGRKDCVKCYAGAVYHA